MFIKNYKCLLILSLLTISLFKFTSLSECEEGCLKCEIDSEQISKCSLCDVFTGFVMTQEHDCLKHEDQNCMVFSSNEVDSVCAQCVKGHIVDINTNECIPVPDERKVQNCHSYTLVGRCSRCARDTYLDENECKEVRVLQSNCFTYFDDSLCSECEEGYKINPSNGSCSKNEETDSQNENCLSSTSGECLECDYGYFKTSNPANFINNKQEYLQKVVEELFWGQKYSQYPISTCVESPDVNCQVFNPVETNVSLVPTCQMCKESYFLDVASGKCVMNPSFGIKNCENYLDFQTCDQCKSEFYLECDECKERTLPYSNCLVSDKRKDQCYECDEGFYLNEANQCVDRSPKQIENCEKYSRLENLCGKCDDGFRITNTLNMCFEEVPNCKTYKEPFLNEDLKLICTDCDDDYFYDEAQSRCNKQDIPNCNIYQPNHNLCTNCHNSYDLDERGYCVTKNVELSNFCENNDSAGKCIKCQNQYYLENDNCLKFDDADCLETDGITPSCVKCIGNRYLKKDENNNSYCSISEKSYLVDHCLESTSSDSYSICTKCEQEYKLAFFQINFAKNPEGCEIYIGNSEQTHMCILAKPDYKLVFNESYTGSEVFVNAVATTTPESICSQVQINQNVSLDNAVSGFCRKCRNPKEYFFNSATNSCWKRSKAQKTDCKENNIRDDECLICSEGFHSIEKTYVEEVTCLENPENFTPLENCLVHDASDNSVCVFCEDDYYLSHDRICIKQGEGNLPFKILKEGIDLNNQNPILNIKRKSETDSSIWLQTHNCKSVVFETKNTTFRCVECKEGYYQTKELEENSIYLDLGMFKYFNLTCLDPNSISVAAKKVEGQKVAMISENDCLNMIKDSGFYSCNACKNGVIPNFVVTKDFTNYSFELYGFSLYSVENCDKNSNSEYVEKKYSGFAYANKETAYFFKFLHLARIVNFDTCKNDQKNLVYLIKTSSEVFSFDYILDDSMPERLKLYDCLNIPTDSNRVDNCHIYGNNPQNWDNFLENLTCISCKPGFKPTYASTISTSITIESCELIENCDFSDSSELTMMNGCTKCKEGYSNPINKDSAEYFIDYWTCKENTIDNCVFHFLDENKCSVCKQGFKLNADKTLCEEIPAIANCDKIGLSSESYDLGDRHSDHYYNFMYNVERVYKNTVKQGKCEVCSSGYSHFVDIQKPLIIEKSNICVSNEGVDDLAENCELFDGTVAKSCVQCKNGYLVTKDGQNCVEKPNDDVFQNCKNLKLNSTSQSYECDECNSGYEIFEQDKMNCYLRVMNCVEFGNITCSKCEDEYVLVFNNDKSNTVCVKDVLNKDDFLGSKPILNSSSDIDPAFLPFDGDEYYYFGRNNSQKWRGNSCTKEKVFSNCQDENHTDFECNICNEGYYKRGQNNQCFPISIPNCIDQDNVKECNECKEGYYLNDLKTCVKRYTSNCQTPSAGEDKCSQCNDSFYLVDGQCFPHTVEHCAEKNETEDKCSQCDHSFYLLDGLCYSHTVIGCKTYKDDKDECETCFDRHYLEDGNCRPHTVRNCKGYSNSSDSCDSCIQNGMKTTNQFVYSLNNQKCQQMKEIDNCKVYYESSALVGKCEECEDKYFLNSDSTMCVKQPEGIRNCQKYINSTGQCQMCNPSYYLDEVNMNCLPVFRPIENCFNHKSKEECDICVEGFIPAADLRSCEAVKESSCKTWENVSKCQTCETNEILNDILSDDGLTVLGTECVAQIENCDTLVGVEYVSQDEDQNGEDDQNQGRRLQETKPYHCKKCLPGFKLNEDQSECVEAATIINCLEYDKDSTCTKCEKGFAVSSDQSECVHENLQVGTNCLNSRLTQQTRCNMCRPGMILNDQQECVECGGEGCMQCDTSNTTTCLICQGGYHMNSSLVCVKNVEHTFELQREELSQSSSSSQNGDDAASVL